MVIAEREVTNGSFYLKQEGSTISLRHKGIFTIYKYGDIMTNRRNRRKYEYREEGDRLCYTYGLSKREEAIEALDSIVSDYHKHGRWSRDGKKR